MASVGALTVQQMKMRTTLGFHQHQRRRSSVCVTRDMPRKKQALVPVMRLFGPAIFEASKLKVLFVGVDGQKHPWKLPRTYTLTHSDVTSMLTLAISETINNSLLQGWYNRLQRDEVVGEWKKLKGKMSLHVHCHKSGGHFLLDLIAKLRYYIFCKELPVVLKAFVHGDHYLFNNYQELQDAMVCVYIHSNLEEYNKVECWGALRDGSRPSSSGYQRARVSRGSREHFRTTKHQYARAMQASLHMLLSLNELNAMVSRPRQGGRSWDPTRLTAAELIWSVACDELRSAISILVLSYVYRKHNLA